MVFKFVTLIFFLSTSLFAQELPVLTWGGDASGSAPYLLLDQKDAKKVSGFQFELAEALARQMGMKAKFIQHQWDNLIPGLKRGNFDIVIDGIEITEDRKKEINFSDPYFHTYLQLSVRKDNTTIQNWEDLYNKKVGSLANSVADRLLREHKAIQTKEYEDQTHLYEDLAFGRIDAVLLDQPAALYYTSVDKRIKNLNKNFGKISYGICVRKEDKELLAKINIALKQIINTGEVRLIYERWGLWNSEMSRVFRDTSPLHEEATELAAFVESINSTKFINNRMQQYQMYIPLLFEGALMTLRISSLAMICAIILGLIIALSRLYAPKPFSFLALAFVEIIRGTPLLIQLFLIYYGLPNVGIKLAPFSAAILGLALNYSAYESEIYRTGILAIPHAQMETAIALGLNRWQALVHVILPQAIRIVIPPMTNDFIALLKDSSLVSVITLVELTRVYNLLAASSFNYLDLGIMTAALYFLMGVPFVRLSRWMEKRFSFDSHSLHNVH